MRPLRILLPLLALPAVVLAEDAAVPVSAVPRPVVSEIVTADPVRARTFPGVIAGRNTATLGFLTGGRIAAIPVDVGARVARGDTLATLDQVTLEQDLAAARAGLDAALAEATLAEQQFARVETLVERGVATRAQLDDARARRDAAAARAATTRASLARAENAAGYARLTAPRDGIVLSVRAEPGETVSSGRGVIELADPAGRDALIDVPESFAQLLPPRASFTLQRHGQDDPPVPAVLSLVEPTTDTSLGTRRLRLTVDAPPEDFRIGSLVEASYATQGDAFLTVPVVAVIDGAALWRVDGTDRIVTRTPVSLGATIGDRVVVTQGIAVGDEIVTRGVHSLTQGQSVGDRLE